MFDPSYKKPIPAYVRTLGVVTAQTGAAVRDIIHVSRRRNPGIRIILYPAKVQGDGAAQSVAAGIAALDSLGYVDVIIAGRGGGSIEDLWAFNEEEVAYAIWNCRTPVISAVGHETDTTIADFVADLRAPTPSAGAELAVADMSAVVLRLEEKRLRLAQLMRHRLQLEQQRSESLRLKLQLKGPEGKLRESMHFLAQIQERMNYCVEMRLRQLQAQMQRAQMLLDARMQEKTQNASGRLEVLGARLSALSPAAKLDAGFAYVEGAGGRGVRSVSELLPGDTVIIHLRDGSAHMKVEEVRSRDGN